MTQPSLQSAAGSELARDGSQDLLDDGFPDRAERWRQRFRLHGDRVRFNVGLGPGTARRSLQAAPTCFFLTPEQARGAAVALKNRSPRLVEQAVKEADRLVVDQTGRGDPTGPASTRSAAAALTRAWFYTNEYRFLWHLADLWRAAHRPRRPTALDPSESAPELRVATWLARLVDGADAALAELFVTEAGRLARGVYARTLVDSLSDPLENLSRAQALCLAGAALPMFEESDKWRRLGRRLISDVLSERLRDDGSLEGCDLPAHHSALELLLEHYQLEISRLEHERSERPAEQPPAGQDLEAAVNRIAKFLAGILQTGWAHPVLRRAAQGVSFTAHEPGGPDLLATAAVLLGRPDLRELTSRPSEASFWLVGPQAAERFDALAAKPRQRGGCRQASGWHVSAHQAGGGCLLAGVESRHEPGGLGFLWQRGERDWVGEKGFGEPGDTLFWSQGETLTLLTARNPAVERSIAHFAAGRAFVLDRFRRPSDAPSQTWRVAGCLERVGINAGSITCETPEGPTLTLLAVSTARWSSEVYEVASESIEAPGERVLGIACRAAPAAAVERAVLLLPGEAARSGGTLSRLAAPTTTGGASAYAWRRDSSLEVFLFSDGSPWEALGWSGRARFVWWRADSSGRIQELVAAPGGELRAGEHSLLGDRSRIRWLRGQGEDLPPLSLGASTDSSRA